MSTSLRALQKQNIPAPLKALPNWLVHRMKKPHDPATGRMGSPTDPRRWTSFERAVSRFESGGFDGIGFGMREEDPYCGIDLDHCLDPDSGEVSGFAGEIVRLCDSYTEVTPSGRGLRVWIEARKPSGKCKRAGERAIEVYDRGRYFTVTGWRLAGGPKDIMARQRELDALIAEEFPERGEDPRRTARRPYEGPLGERIDLEEFLSAAGVAVREESHDITAEHVFHIVCPWVREHADGDRSGTRVGQYRDGALFFHCEHSHCSHRRWAEFRVEVDPRVSVKIRRCKARRVWGRSA